MSLLSKITKAVKGAVKAVSKVVSKVAKGIETAVTNVVKNPLPIIEAAALTAIGIPAPIASAAVSAANGGNIKDIATAAATSYAGQQTGQVAGASATDAGASQTIAKIAAGATGASTQATLTGLAQGKGLQDSLSSGLKSGIVAGITTGGIEGLKATFPGDSSGIAPIEERGTIAATGEAAIDTGGQQFPTQAEAATSSLTGPIGPTESKLLSSALYPAVYTSLFGSSSQAPISGGTTTPKPPVQPVSPVQTTAGPGTQALAQALRIGDAGAPVFGGDKEGGKKSGWNVESLRYMGNSEA